MSKDIIDDVDVCHLVAYGDYWRLTFPLLEKRLVKNLPSPYKVGLRAIKAMLDRDTETDYKELLPSYRVKVAILKASSTASHATTSLDAFGDALREVLLEDSSGQTTPYIEEDLISPLPQPTATLAIKHLIKTIHIFENILIYHEAYVNLYKLMYLLGMIIRCVSLCLLVYYMIDFQINSFLITDDNICGAIHKSSRNISWVNEKPRHLSEICLSSENFDTFMKSLAFFEEYHPHWKRCVNMIPLCSFHQSVRYSLTRPFTCMSIAMFLGSILVNILPCKHPLAESHKILPKMRLILIFGVSQWSWKCNIDIQMISMGTGSSVEPVTLMIGVVLPLFVVLMQLLFHKYEFFLYRGKMWFAIWGIINVLGFTKAIDRAHVIAYHHNEQPFSNMYVILTAWNITVTAFLYLMEDVTRGRYVHISWAISCLFYILPVYKMFPWISQIHQNLSNSISIFIYIVLRLHNVLMYSIL